MTASGGKGAANDAAVNTGSADQAASVEPDAAEAVERAERKVAKQREHLEAAERALDQARNEQQDAPAGAVPQDGDN
jgi:hypothetical protein